MSCLDGLAPDTLAATFALADEYILPPLKVGCTGAFLGQVRCTAFTDHVRPASHHGFIRIVEARKMLRSGQCL